MGVFLSDIDINEPWNSYRMLLECSKKSQWINYQSLLKLWEADWNIILSLCFLSSNIQCERRHRNIGNLTYFCLGEV
jgi:hypothetical protein